MVPFQIQRQLNFPFRNLQPSGNLRDVVAFFSHFEDPGGKVFPLLPTISEMDFLIHPSHQGLKDLDLLIQAHDQPVSDLLFLLKVPGKVVADGLGLLNPFLQGLGTGPFCLRVGRFPEGPSDKDEQAEERNNQGRFHANQSQLNIR